MKPDQLGNYAQLGDQFRVDAALGAVRWPDDLGIVKDGSCEIDELVFIRRHVSSLAPAE